jgi:glycosyltransferase involved in cell wall biosynthesis
LVRHRDRSSIRCTVAALSGSPELAGDLQAAGAEVVELGLASPFDLPAVTAKLASLLLTRRPDVVHTHLLHAEILGGLVARLARVPVVIATAHNTFWDDASYGRILRGLYRYTVRSNHHTIAVSEAVRAKLVATGALADRVTTVVNGLSPVEKLPRAQARAALGLDPDELVIGAIGNLYPYKGHDLLVQALAELHPRYPRLAAVVIGEGQCRGALEAQARAAHLEGRLRLVGRRPRAAELLAAFDLYVQPSRSEGLGLGLLEAMAAGVPAVAFAVGGIPELVGVEGAALLVEPGDHRALAAAIDRAIMDPSLREELALRGRRRAGAFNAARMTRAYEEIYFDRLRKGDAAPIARAAGE